MSMAAGYTIFTYRSFAGKISTRDVLADNSHERDELATASR